MGAVLPKPNTVPPDYIVLKGFFHHLGSLFTFKQSWKRSIGKFSGALNLKSSVPINEEIGT